MAGLLDFLSSPAQALYGNVLPPDAVRALPAQGLLAAAGAIGANSAPSRLPTSPLGSLALGLGAYGQGQNAAAQNAVASQFVGAQGANLRNLMAMRQQYMGLLPQAIAAMQRGGGVAQGQPSATPGSVPGGPPAPGAPAAPGPGGAMTAPLTDVTQPLSNDGMQRAVWQIESGGRVSGVPDGKDGEIGPMQIKPGTGAPYLPPGTDPNVALRDDATNLKVGGAHLDALLTHYHGDQDAAVVAYNGGSGLADKWLASGKNMSVLPGGTQSYLAKYHQLTGGAGAPMGAGSPVPPSNGMQAPPRGIDPMAMGIAAMGAGGQMAGLGDVMKPFETAYYGSPGYIGQKAAAEAGGQYAGPGANPALQGEISKQKAIGEMSGPGGFSETRGPGSAVVNKQTGQVVYQAPMSRNTFDAKGIAHQEWFYPPGSPNNPTGGPIPAGPTTGTSNGAAGAQGATGVPGNPPAAPGSGLGPVTELGPLREAQLHGVGETDAQVRIDNIKAGNMAQQQQASLLAMKSDAPNFYTGPFSAHAQQANSLLRLIDPNFNQTVANYEDFNKNQGLVMRQAVHDESSKAAFQEFKLIGSQLPNPDMSPAGLVRTINEYMGLNNFRAAKVQAQAQWEMRPGTAGPGDTTGFETDWQKNVSPYAFIVAQMEPADRQNLFAQVGKTTDGQAELKLLTQQMQYVKRLGLDQNQL